MNINKQTHDEFSIEYEYALVGRRCCIVIGSTRCWTLVWQWHNSYTSGFRCELLAKQDADKCVNSVNIVNMSSTNRNSYSLSGRGIDTAHVDGHFTQIELNSVRGPPECGTFVQFENFLVQHDPENVPNFPMTPQVDFPLIEEYPRLDTFDSISLKLLIFKLFQ